jgi:hypothetical protein
MLHGKSWLKAQFTVKALFISKKMIALCGVMLMAIVYCIRILVTV